MLFGKCFCNQLQMPNQWQVFTSNTSEYGENLVFTLLLSWRRNHMKQPEVVKPCIMHSEDKIRDC